MGPRPWQTRFPGYGWLHGISTWSIEVSRVSGVVWFGPKDRSEQSSLVKIFGFLCHSWGKSKNFFENWCAGSQLFSSVMMWHYLEGLSKFLLTVEKPWFVWHKCLHLQNSEDSFEIFLRQTVEIFIMQNLSLWRRGCLRKIHSQNSVESFLIVRSNILKEKNMFNLLSISKHIEKAIFSIVGQV